MINNKLPPLCLALIVGAFFIFLPNVVLANDYSHTTVLEPGWNIVSTPRLVESHEFSADETLTNFDIYLLDPSSPSGWATMADLGQSEFTPLYGYFINNKTGVNQTLTLNYLENVSPEDRLFDRDLVSGWNVVGIANPSYALRQYEIGGDQDNPAQILVSLDACADLVVDLTAGVGNPSSVTISDTWESRTFAQVNELYDLRETKAYAVYIDGECSYQGFQNNEPVYEEHGTININVAAPNQTEIDNGSEDAALAMVDVLVLGEDVIVDEIRLDLITEFSGMKNNLINLEIIDPVNNVHSTTSNPYGTTTITELIFADIELTAGVNYNLVIRGDIPVDTMYGQTYQLVAKPLLTFARWQPSNSSVLASDVTYNTLQGPTITVTPPAAHLEKITTSNNIVVKGATNVLLYKGKITARDIEDLHVIQLIFDGMIGDQEGSFDLDWEKMYLYVVNSDSSESLLDDTTLLNDNQVMFTGFDLIIPKGDDNGRYIVVRGDVKNSPLGTTTKIGFASAINQIIKDSDDDILKSFQKIVDTSKGHNVTVVTAGTYFMEVDTELSGINNDKNILAGTIALIGRLKFNATKENAIIEDLVIQNTGTADNNTLGRIYLYEDREMTQIIGTADMAAGANPKVLFEDINYEISKIGVTYVYLAGMIKGVDYSSSPDENKTSVAETTVILRVPANAPGYNTKVLGKDTGEILTFPGATSNTKTGTVLGAIMSNITTDFANGTLAPGTARDIFSFKVTAPSSSNIDPDGDGLGIKLGTVTFTYATTGPPILDFNNLRIQRVGGADGEQTAITTFDKNAKLFTIDFENTYGFLIDLTIRPGDTAEYVVRADITGSDGTGDSLQVTIESVDTNVNYIHETGVGTNTGYYPPLLAGISHVRGGTLSN